MKRTLGYSDTENTCGSWHPSRNERRKWIGPIQEIRWVTRNTDGSRTVAAIANGLHRYFLISFWNPRNIS